MVALALQDDGLRQRIKNDMRNAPYLEHKLSFTRYVRGTSGGILLAAMAKNSDKTRQEIIALMESVRPLEFYMPVDEHREAWTGEANLLVVSALDEGVDAELNAFGLTGERVYVSPVTPPSIPTFSLVPVETNFDRPLDMSEWENVNDQGGQAIGTYRRTKPIDRDGPSLQGLAPDDGCIQPTGTEILPPCGGGGGGGGSTRPAGLYMTALNLDDLHEPWFRGDPEIEVHIQGPADGDPTKGKSLSCAGEHASSYRRFDMNDHNWSGNVLLFTQQQAIAFRNEFGDNASFNIMVWEDDDTACVIKTDTNVLLSFLNATRNIHSGISVIIKNPEDKQAWVQGVRSFIAAAYETASFLKTNDDFVGVMPRDSLDIPVNVPVEYDVDLGGDKVGSATLILRP